MNSHGETDSQSGGMLPPRYAKPLSARHGTWMLPVLALTAGAAVLFLFDPERFGFYPVCFFHRTTGLLCPGCGSLRALHQLLHGNVAAALHYNSLLVLSLPLFGWLALRFVLLKQRPAEFHAGWLWLGLAVVVVFGIARNLPFATSAWLAP